MGLGDTYGCIVPWNYSTLQLLTWSYSYTSVLCTTVHCALLSSVAISHLRYHNTKVTHTLEHSHLPFQHLTIYQHHINFKVSCYLIELNEMKLMLMMQVLLVMKKKHYTKLVTIVTIVTIVSMFSAMITDLHQYWRRELSQLASISQEGKRRLTCPLVLASSFHDDILQNSAET